MRKHNAKKYFNRRAGGLAKITVCTGMQRTEYVKVFNHEAKTMRAFCELSENFRKQSTNALSFAGMMIPTIVSLSYLNYAVSACAGGLLAIRGLMDLGSLSAYLVYVRQSAMPLNQFTQQVNFLLSALSGAERIFDMMDEQPEVDEGNVHLCHVVKNADGTLTECEQSTPDYAWKVPENGGFRYVELKGDVRFSKCSLWVHR